MKRILTVCVTALMLSAALAVSAFASDFDSVAKELSGIGMFRGTLSGDFELDRAPTRSEAAIMLVRLYGAEEEAASDYKDGKISHPFTDVGDISAPYVAWLYTNGLTKGTTDTTFGGSSKCTLSQYTVFLLRALGYSDGKDFAFSDALTYAQQKGFYDPMIFSGDFLRDDLAALTYQALGTDLKDGSAYLLESLIESGAVEKDAAASMTKKIEAYRALTAASAGMSNSAFDADLKLDMNLAMTYGGEKTDFSVALDGNMKTILDAKNLQMAYDFDMTLLGSSMNLKAWMKDNYLYQSTTVDGETTSVKYPVATEEQLSLLESYAALQSSTSVSGLALVDSITTSTSGANTVYTVVINAKSMNAALENLMGLVGTDLGLDSSALSFDDVTAVYTVASGSLKSMKMSFAATMKVDAGDGSMMDASCNYDVDMVIKATGDSVKITYPDFSKFEEITLPENGAAA